MTSDSPIRVVATSVFIRAAKRLRKKYPHLREDLEPFTNLLESGNTSGDRLQDVEPFIVYKLRIPNRDAQRGKSGGYRVIYYIKQNDLIWLLYIYSKSEQEDISADDVREWIISAENDLEAP